MALLVGGSQMAVEVYAATGLLTVVVAWGGGLLVGFGCNLVRNRPALYNGWNEDDEHGWLSLLIVTVATAYVLVAAGLIRIG